MSEQEQPQQPAPAPAPALSTKNTKECLKLVFALAKALKEAKSNDGKISVQDLTLAIGVFPHVGPALEEIEKVPAELKDCDAAEATDLLKFSAAHLPGLVPAELQANVDLALEAAVPLIKLVLALAKKK